MASDKLRVSGDADEVFALSMRAIKKCGWVIQSQDARRRIVRAHTKMSLRSWGDEVVVRVRQGETGSQIDVSSNPKAQLFDWWRGQENIAQFKKCLRELM